ncbi:MAG: flagellar brake protein [Pseudomonadales bacterium]|nr:flagellar brake protein [Pseudomonadales bacterium]
MPMGKEVLTIAPGEAGLNHIQLKFGEVLQVQFVNDGERFHVRLIGYLENRSIIVTVPVKNRHLVSVRTGLEINVRMMVGGRACAFTTNISHLYRSPYPHMHLDYPDALITSFVRKAVRVETRIDGTVVNLVIGDRGKETACFLLDISVTGAHLVTSLRIGKSNDEIELSLVLDIMGIQRILRIKARLLGRLKVKQPTEKREVHYGVEFLPLPQDNLIELYAFVYSKLATTA